MKLFKIDWWDPSIRHTKCMNHQFLGNFISSLGQKFTFKSVNLNYKLCLKITTKESLFGVLCSSTQKKTIINVFVLHPKKAKNKSQSCWNNLVQTAHLWRGSTPADVISLLQQLFRSACHWGREPRTCNVFFFPFFYF